MRSINKYFKLFSRFLKECNVKVNSCQLYSILHECQPLPVNFINYVKMPREVKYKWSDVLEKCDFYRQEIETHFRTFLDYKELTDIFFFNYNSIEGKKWRKCHGYESNFSAAIKHMQHPQYIMSEAFGWGEEKFTQQDEVTQKLVCEQNNLDWWTIEDEFLVFLSDSFYGFNKENYN